MYLDDPQKWAVLAERLLAAGEAGYDTETYGQPEKTSPQYRARIHCWSVAILGTTRSPRGYRRAGGVVLPRAALEFRPLRDALSSIQLWAHNAPHDYHASSNEGLQLQLRDSLQILRCLVPGMRLYDLKSAEQWALGKPARASFLDMVKYEEPESTTRYKTVTRCVCGKVPCRVRSTAEWWDAQLGWFRLHERQDVKLGTEVVRIVAKRYQVTDFVPGAALVPMPDGRDRLAAWWAYSLADAVSGIELVDWIRNHKNFTTEKVYPWDSSLASRASSAARR